MVLKIFSTENGSHVFVASADYTRCNFAHLRDEYKKRGYISWEVTGKGNQNCRPGDVVYFYFFNLPFAASNQEGSLLLRGIVTEPVSEMSRHQIYGNNDHTVCPGFSIGDLQPIGISSKFCRSNLLSSYGFKSFYPSIQVLYEDQAQLYFDVEAELKTNAKCSFSDLIDYFERPCVFQDLLHPKGNPLTFRTRSNGLLYYERHHVIPRSIAKKVKDAAFVFNVLESPDNCVNLCPCCHRRIHHGMPEDVEKMVEYLYQEKKAFFDRFNVNQYLGSDVLGALKSLYLT